MSKPAAEAPADGEHGVLAGLGVQESSALWGPAQRTRRGVSPAAAGTGVIRVPAACRASGCV